MLDARKIICLGVLILVGCGPQDRSEPIPMPKATPLGAESDRAAPESIREAKERRFGDMTFDVPAGWEEKALSSSMILGEFTLPGEAGAARLTLSTAGGGTAANLDRWKGQFRQGAGDPAAKESPIKAAGKEATLLELYGTHTDMFGGGSPKENWQLLGAAIPIDSDHNYFLKMTGPRETVAAHRDEFVKFVESARFR